jgi:vancomycin resistance protein VanW
MLQNTKHETRNTKKLRQQLGKLYYCFRRYIRWMTGPERWAVRREPALPISLIEHQTPLLRQLKDVDMYLQHNKIVNLRLAAACIDGTVLYPGETWSFWKSVGAPSRRKGYLDGLVLQSGRIGVGVGGGLCQMGNLLYWMALHTPLTVVERWRHSYDVFPDTGRTLPFGSGATLAYNYIDLQLRNDTDRPFQLNVLVGEIFLHGSISSNTEWPERYHIVETDHAIRHETWGGYSRHNRIERKVFDTSGVMLRQELMTENHALLMYQPFLEA